MLYGQSMAPSTRQTSDAASAQQLSRRLVQAVESDGSNSDNDSRRHTLHVFERHHFLPSEEDGDGTNTNTIVEQTPVSPVPVEQPLPFGADSSSSADRIGSEAAGAQAADPVSRDSAVPQHAEVPEASASAQQAVAGSRSRTVRWLSRRHRQDARGSRQQTPDTSNMPAHAMPPVATADAASTAPAVLLPPAMDVPSAEMQARVASSMQASEPPAPLALQPPAKAGAEGASVFELDLRRSASESTEARSAAAMPMSASTPHSPAGEKNHQAAHAASVDDRTAWQIVSGNLARCLRSAAFGLRQNLAQTAIGLTLSAMCCVAVALSVLAYMAVRSFESSGDSAAGSDGSPFPPGTAPGDVDTDLDPTTLLGTGYSTAVATMSHRVAFGSKYSAVQARAAGQDVWAAAVLPARPDAWIWAGNMAYFDQPLINCASAQNAARPECQCGTAPLPPCGNVTYQSALAAANALTANGYGSLLNAMCNNYLTLYGTIPPGSLRSVCPKPILGVYGVHDSFGLLSDRSTSGKEAIKEVYADMLGTSAYASTQSSLRGMFSRTRIYEDAAKGRSMDVYLLDEHFDRAPVPCAAVASTCSAHPDTV